MMASRYTQRCPGKQRVEYTIKRKMDLDRLDSIGKIGQRLEKGKFRQKRG
jgi:hypothetical protein